MVREAIESLGGKTTNVELRDWILAKFPGTNRSTIQCQIIICTVNHLSRIHYPENRKPRIAEGPYDFLFRPARGRIELFDAARHGRWRIVETEDGEVAVASFDDDAATARVGAEAVSPAQDEGSVEVGCAGFAAEHHLRDYLVQHLESIEPGLQLYVDEEGDDGVEYPTQVGRIDILATDRAGHFVVIELKVSRGPDAVAGQVLRYKNWVRHHLSDGRRVRGIIVAQHISDRIRYAIASDPDIYVKQYELNLWFRDLPSIIAG
jgi:hypothetical protein